MSTRDLVCVTLALVVGGCVGVGVTPRAMESPNLGREATPAQIAGWDISVGPDGVGLPPGKGTPATGAIVYEQKCQVCHGAKGAGQPNDRLVGGQGAPASKAPVRTIGRHWPDAAAFDRSAPEELRAVRGVVASILGMLEGGATHLGVATDHVIESFRNTLWPGYKTGEGLEPLLYAQFQPLEDALSALGVVVWPMVEFETVEALAAAAVMAAADARVDQVVVCTPDKDLAQCVRGDRIVQLDRRTRELRNESAVRQKFGVSPASIPDWLALVGDSADGYPGLPGWGEKSAAMVLARYEHLEHIPKLATEWDVSVRGATRLAATLTEQRDRALLFRELATLRADAPIGADVDALRWRGPRADFAAWSGQLGTPALHERASTLAATRAAVRS